MKGLPDEPRMLDRASTPHSTQAEGIKEGSEVRGFRDLRCLGGCLSGGSALSYSEEKPLLVVLELLELVARILMC